MRARLYRDTRPVRAEQVRFGEPLPLGVENTNSGLRVRSLYGESHPVKTDDWVVRHDDGRTQVFSPEQFARRFEEMP